MITHFYEYCVKFVITLNFIFKLSDLFPAVKTYKNSAVTWISISKNDRKNSVKVQMFLRRPKKMYILLIFSNHIT